MVDEVDDVECDSDGAFNEECAYGDDDDDDDDDDDKVDAEE